MVQIILGNNIPQKNVFSNMRENTLIHFSVSDRVSAGRLCGGFVSFQMLVAFWVLGSDRLVAPPKKETLKIKNISFLNNLFLFVRGNPGKTHL